MKICWVFYDRKDYTGGPVINALRILPELVKRGHQVWAFVGHNGTECSSIGVLEAVGVKCIPYKVRFTSDVNVRFFLNKVAEIKPDVFVSNISTQAAFAGRWIRKWGIPVVHTHRSDDALNRGTALFFFTGPLRWRLDALVAVNGYLLEGVQKKAGSGFTGRIIPSGVPVSPLPVGQEHDISLNVAYAGRFDQKQKRIVETLNSFVDIARAAPEFNFSLIGDGEPDLTQRLKAIVTEAGLKERIRFTGRLWGEEYKQELARHQVIVLLSDYEGTPGSLMDGMSCGLVPVALQFPGLNDLVQDQVNGLVVTDRDRHFQEALNKLHQDRALRRRLAAAARKTIENGFSVESATTSWESLFNQLTSKKTNRKIKIPAKTLLPAPNPLLLQHQPRISILRKWLNKLNQGIAVR